MRSGVTVFIPLYNEETILKKNVFKLVEYLVPLDRPYQIILGSNGSTDSTAEIGRELDLQHPNITFFHLPLRGPGLAFAEAVKRAGYPYFLCLDADLSIDLDFISYAIKALQDHDAVVGSKQVGNQKRPFYRIIASDIFIAFTKRLLKLPYRDYAIGAKAYRTGAIRPLL
ncbi:MAG TPA: glycosyltransferase family 2 protein, partial [Desulfobacterales bacterium]|nr:glycosyltransferase family 2 protein [Desulfobacterales bacterium]